MQRGVLEVLIFKEMKSLLTLFVLMILAAISTAQISYRPFPVSEAKWIHTFHDPWSFSFSQQTEVDGDTLIDSESYIKIFQNGHYAGALREESKIVYFVPDTSVTEYELYNFNLVLGDYMVEPFGGAPCAEDTVWVTYEYAVQSTLGMHRALHLSSGVTWIEGIGSTTEVLLPNHLNCVSPNFSLTCMSSDLGFVYPNAYGSCFTVIQETVLYRDNVETRPNPFQESTVIKFSQDAGRVYLRLFNTIGVLVRSLTVDTSSPFELKREGLTNGVYVLQFSNGQGQLHAQKLIVH